jgi:hypothetical protein
VSWHWAGELVVRGGVATHADGATGTRRCAESEKRLIKKCRELNSEIVANAAKVQTALKLSEEDQSTIAALKKEIEKAWKLVDASHEKEARAKETIQQLKLEITNLSRLVEQGAGLSLGQEQTVRALRSLGALRPELRTAPQQPAAPPAPSAISSSSSPAHPLSTVSRRRSARVRRNPSQALSGRRSLSVSSAGWVSGCR